MHTSKEHFAEMKRQTRYISLTKNSNQFLVDPLFRQRILSLVDDPSLQVAWRVQDRFGVLGEHYDATLLCNLNRISVSGCKARSFSLITNVEEVELATDDYLSDFSCFAQIRRSLSIAVKSAGRTPKYDLSCFSPTLERLCLYVRQVANYHLLTNLRSVEFHGCDSIIDVSCFCRAKIVKFIRCPNVTNVNSLASVKELVLLSCDGVTDVSALGTVKEMIIRNCKNLHNLSALSSVYSLTVSDFPQNLRSPLLF
jgi:hypothetical protein